MTTSCTTQAIRDISKESCASVLKPFGFRRRSPHFYRESQDLIHAVHFQASQWGSSDSGSFTINLVVTSPVLYPYWTGRAFPKNPATAAWPVQVRLGTVCPEERDMWWDVEPETDISALGADISARLQEHAIPFFDSFPDSAPLLHALSQQSPLRGVIEAQIPLIQAMLLVERGERSEARALLQSVFREREGNPFQQTVVTIAKRLEVELESA